MIAELNVLGPLLQDLRHSCTDRSKSRLSVRTAIVHVLVEARTYRTETKRTETSRARPNRPRIGGGGGGTRIGRVQPKTTVRFGSGDVSSVADHLWPASTAPAADPITASHPSMPSFGRNVAAPEFSDELLSAAVGESPDTVSDGPPPSLVLVEAPSSVRNKYAGRVFKYTQPRA